MSTTRAAAVLATATVAVATLLTTSSASPPTAAPTNPDPRLFKHPHDNPFFPLTPGLVTRLRGADGDERFKQTVRVTTRTKVVAGVTTTVVRDVVRRLDGTLAEKTVDWYAADDDGNVWYFGEDTATYDENGTLEDREGSWEAGVDGAVAGIVMPADPRPSRADYMEFAKGEAEDQAWVVQRLPYVVTPGGRQDHVVRTLEWSRLEPDVAAGDEHFWLVSASGG